MSQWNEILSFLRFILWKRIFISSWDKWFYGKDSVWKSKISLLKTRIELGIFFSEQISLSNRCKFTEFLYIFSPYFKIKSCSINLSIIFNTKIICNYPMVFRYTNTSVQLIKKKFLNIFNLILEKSNSNNFKISYIGIVTYVIIRKVMYTHA